MDSNLKGNIGEAKAILFYMNKGYEVFTPVGTASTVDLIISRDSRLYRVSVKTTTNMKPSGKYEVDLRQRTRRGNIKFDKNSCDLVLVYVFPEDRVIELNSKSIENTTSISV